MMNISPDQIRAARALLDWNQGKLAEEARLSIDLVSKIEKGDSQGSVKSRQKIFDVLDKGGIEFLDNDGVRKKTSGMQTLKGREGFLEFIWDVYETVKNEGGEVCVSNVKEDDFEYWLGDQDEIQAEKMASLTNINFKILIETGDTNFSAGSYAEYRWVDKETFSSVPFYVYGDKLAMILFKEDVKIYVIHDADIANAQRVQFAVTWESADIPVIKGNVK